MSHHTVCQFGDFFLGLYYIFTLIDLHWAVQKSIHLFIFCTLYVMSHMRFIIGIIEISLLIVTYTTEGLAGVATLRRMVGFIEINLYQR